MTAASRTLLSLLSLLCAVGPGVAQESEPDEIRRARAAVERATEHGDRRAVGEAWRSLAIAQRKHARPRDCLGSLAGALAEFQRADATDRAAVVLQMMASVHFALQEYEDSLARLRQAMAITADSGDRATAARIRANIGAVWLEFGDATNAAEQFEFALREMTAAGAPREIGKVRANLATAYSNIGEWTKAIALMELARDEMLERGLRDEAIGLLGNIGNVHQSRGDFSMAIELFERAVREAREAKLPHVERDNLGNLGGAHMRLGNYGTALDFAELQLAASRAAADAGGAAAATELLGLLRMDLGQWDEALPFLEESRAGYRALGLRGRAASIAQLLSLARWNVGEHAAALSLVREAIGELDGLGQEPAELGAKKLLAHFLRRDGSLDEARDLALEVVARGEEIGSFSARFGGLNELGRLHLDRGDAAAAVACLERSLQLVQADPGNRNGPWVLTLLARAHLERGEPEDALGHARRALEMQLADPVGSELGERQRFGLQDVTRDAADLGLRAAHRLLEASELARENALAAAFWCSESARALLLAERIANRQSLLQAQLPPELLESEAAARERVRASQRRIAALCASPRPADDALAAARHEIDLAYRDLDAVVARIRREQRRVAQLVFPRPLSLADLRRTLPERTAALSFTLTQEHAIAIVVRRDRAELLSLGDSERLRERVRAYLGLVALVDESDRGRTAEAERRIAAELFETLLGPAADALAGAERILLCPDQELAFLPFEALLDASGTRVLRRWQVAYQPSLTVYAMLVDEHASRRGRGLLALGDPVYPSEATAPESERLHRDVRVRGLEHLPRLPATGDEVRRLASMFSVSTVLLREQATLSQWHRALGASRGRLAAVHFACHGHVDPHRPLLTGLVLGDGEVLGLDRIQRSSIDADLAVLSACETARGSVVYAEGVVGLARSFFFAGVPRVVVTGFQLADADASALMVAFYEKMCTEELAPGPALRAAKLELLEARAHPGRWAGFTLWGLPE